MQALFAVYSAELLKLKRSIALKLVFLIPLLIILLMIGTLLNKNPELYDKEMFDNMLCSVHVSWLIIVLPMFLAIEVGLISSSEQATSQWKHIFCLPIPRKKILFAKWLVEITIMIAAHLILITLFVLSFPMLALFMPQINFVIYLSALDFLGLFAMICLSSIGLASLHYAFALLSPGIIPAIAFGVVAVTFSMGITWSTVGINWFPWTLTLVAVSKYIPLEGQFSMLQALGISLLATVLSITISIPLFAKKDIY
jgi:lantibiotic transport system permease protein